MKTFYSPESQIKIHWKRFIKLHSGKETRAGVTNVNWTKRLSLGVWLGEERGGSHHLYTATDIEPIEDRGHDEFHRQTLKQRTRPNQSKRKNWELTLLGQQTSMTTWHIHCNTRTTCTTLDPTLFANRNEISRFTKDIGSWWRINLTATAPIFNTHATQTSETKTNNHNANVYKICNNEQSHWPPPLLAKII